MVAGAAMINSQTASAQVACDGGQNEIVTVVVPNTDPQETVRINRKHVFCGEVSGKRAKGFHSRPKGQNPSTVDTVGADIVQHRVVVDEDGDEEPTGLYNLRDFYITQNGQRRRKSVSTMYPDTCSYNNVMTAIANASNVKSNFSGATCRTAQGNEFPIQLYWLNGYINTAFPIVQ